MICILCVVSYTIPDTTFPRHKIQVRHINRPACKLYWIIANKKLIAVEEREGVVIIIIITCLLDDMLRVLWINRCNLLHCELFD